MSKTQLQKIDRERTLARAREPRVLEKLCRITLADNALEAIDITWCEGLGKPTNLYILEPGKSIVWPLNRTTNYFGPFDLYKVYEETTDEQVLNALRDRISVESARFMFRYDYPRDDRTSKPIGPHRAPDCTMSVLSGDGAVEQTVRLYEVYGLGEFDDLKFEHKPSVEELEAHFQAKLRAKDEMLETTRREMAELRGMVLGKQIAETAPQAEAEATEDLFASV
jgi:hypothetical protein